MFWAVLAIVALLAAAASSDLKEAVQALEQQDYARAAELLEGAVDEDPDNASVRFNLAYSYAQLKQNEKAIEQYQKVVEQKPDLAAARMNLGILLMESERDEEAARHFEAVAAARPGEFAPVFYYAHALLSSGKAEKAIAPYKKALELDPGSAEANLGLGRALARTGQPREAIEYYRQAAELDPGLSQMTLEVAEILERDNHIEEALELYSEYLQSNSDAIAVRERVGLLLMEAERYPEAIRILERAAAENPSAANQAALAEAYSLNDQPEKALPFWRMAVEAEPSNPQLRLRYANSLLHAGQSEDAARNYLVALENDRTLTDAWNGLAFSLYTVENYQGALKALRQSEQLNPPKPAQVYLRAIIEDKLDMHEEALATYQKFLATNSRLADEEWKSKQRIKVLEKVLRKR